MLLRPINAIKCPTHFTFSRRTDASIRSRNPRHVDIQTYHNATGLETLIGYLYLEGNIKRIEEVLLNTKTTIYLYIYYQI